MPNVGKRIGQRASQQLGPFAVVLQQMEGMALRRAGADAGQPLQCCGEPV
jgi:hypothetical protein